MYIKVLRLVVDDFYSLWNKSLIDFDWIPGRGENTTGLIKMKKVDEVLRRAVTLVCPEKKWNSNSCLLVGAELVYKGELCCVMLGSKGEYVLCWCQRGEIC